MPAIRHRHLKRLLEASLSLPEPAQPALPPGPKPALYGLPLAAWPPRAAGGGRSAEVAPAAARIAARSTVAGCLRALARRIDDVLPGAILSARQAWERVDAFKILDGAILAQIAEARAALLDDASAGGPAMRAIAVEGLIAVDTAWGLARLLERRLSSLIRLWVRAGQGELLPEGRPFLDLAAALQEAARAWS